MNYISLSELSQLLNKPLPIIITTHKSPDGDAMGSSLALYHFLNNRGHKVKVITPNAWPDNLSWMPGIETCINAEKDLNEALQLINTAAVIFTLDFNNLSRIDQLNEPLTNANGIKVMIDHHLQPSNYAHYMLSDTKASSTCELIHVFIESLNAKSEITETIATAIYTGILTDTASFKFYSCTSRTHQVVAHLLDVGLKNQKIHEYIYDNNTENKIRLEGYALSKKMYLLKNLPVAITSLTQNELKSFDYKPGDTEGIVNKGLSLAGIKLSAFFVEQSSQIKISLRSKGNFNVNEFARKYFNGGGHANAAGASSPKNMEETIKEFETIINKYNNELS